MKTIIYSKKALVIAALAVTLIATTVYGFTKTITPNVTPAAVTTSATLTPAVTDTTKGIVVDQYGNATFTKSGVFSYLLIQGKVDIKAANVTLSNIKVLANPTNMTPPPMTVAECQAAVGKTFPAINATRGYANFVIEDSEIKPTTQSVLIDNGIFGSNMTVRRVSIANVVDGIGVFAPNGGDTKTVIENNTIQNLYVGPYSPGHGCNQPSHSDGIQIHYGSNIQVRNNTILATSTTTNFANAAIMINENGGFRTTNVTIANNTLDHGACTVNVYRGSMNMTGISNLHIDNNTFGKNARTIRGTSTGNPHPCAMTVDTVTRMRSDNTFNGNVWIDGSIPLPPVDKG